MTENVLLSALAGLEQETANTFVSRHNMENFRQTVYGGQVLAIAVAAAHRCMKAAQLEPERLLHSLHAYFLRPGRATNPVYYVVENLRDGRNISTRHVVARQGDHDIFHATLSFHLPEPGFHHQDSAPGNLPDPEALLAASTSEGRPAEHGNDTRESSPFILLGVPDNPFTSSAQQPAEAIFWLRARHDIPRDNLAQMASLAFASDLGLLATAVLPHPSSLFATDLTAASIDHAMWFHSANIDLNDWLLCVTHSPWAGNARGFATARFYTRAGQLIATSTQEGLIRPAEKKGLTIT